MKCLNKLLCLFSIIYTLTSFAHASTSTGSSVNVTFKVTFINPAFDVSLPTYIDFGNTIVGERNRLDKPFEISFSSESQAYSNFHDAPYPLSFFAQNTTVGAQDNEISGNMQQFFYLGCDNTSRLTKITVTPIELDTLASPINDLSTCRLYMDTNPEASPGEVISTLNFTVKYP